MSLKGAVLLCPIYGFAVGHIISRQTQRKFERIDASNQYTLKDINKLVVNAFGINYFLLIVFPTVVYAHIPKERYAFLHPLYQQAVDANQPYLSGIFSTLAILGGVPGSARSPTMIFEYYFPLCVTYAVIIPAVLALLPGAFYLYKSLCLNVQFPTSNNTRRILSLLLVGWFSFVLVESMVNQIHMFDLNGLRKAASIAQRAAHFATLLVVGAGGLLLLLPHLFQAFKPTRKDIY